MADISVLRANQQKAMAEVSALYRAGTKRVLLQASVAFGKSTTASYMLGRTRMRTLILAPRIEIVNQIAKALTVPHGFYLPGKIETKDPIQIGMVPTVVRRLDGMPDFDWIISDEAHWSAAEGWRRILDRWKDKFHLGMSATPCRLDNLPLSDNYDAMVRGPTPEQMLADGYLVPARVFAPPIDLGKLRKQGGEYAAEQFDGTLGKRELIGGAIEKWREHADGRKTLVFCYSLKHAEEVAQQFREAGIRATTVDGGMDKAERRRRFDEFETGPTNVLCNVDIATTGYDYPRLSCIMWLRKTASLALWLQGNGRAARICPWYGKTDYIVLDLAGNAEEHGHPHEDREWSLTGKPKRAREDDYARCGDCLAWVKRARICSACGAVMEGMEAAKPPGEREALEVVDGEIVEIGSDELTRLRQGNFHELVAKAHTLQDLQKIAAARGFKPNWAANVMQAKIVKRARYRRQGAA